MVPVFLLFFAQGKGQPKLDSLDNECKEVGKVLNHFDGVEIIIGNNIQINDFSGFIEARRMERLVLFNFSGHTDFDRITVGNGDINPISIADYLNINSPYLKVVFLNGCSNIEQVNAFFRAGAKVVIATQSPVQDLKASCFSIAFYSALQRKKTLEEAFKSGIAKINEPLGSNYVTNIIYRGGLITNEQFSNWIMVVSENDKTIIKVSNWWEIGIISLNFSEYYIGTKKDFFTGLFILTFFVLGLIFIFIFIFYKNIDATLAFLGLVSICVSAFLFFSHKKYKMSEVNSDLATQEVNSCIKIFKTGK